MRVLVISNMYPSRREPVYGTFVRDQVAQLRGMGVEVDLAVNTNRRTGLPHVPLKYARLAALGLRRAAARRHDVVHAHYLLPTGAIAAAVARARRSALVVTCHGSDVLLGDRSTWLRRAATATLRSADAVIAVSERARSDLAARYGIEPDGIHVIDMGVDAARFAVDAATREATRARLSDGGGPLVICVAHLVARKNVVSAVEALALMERGQLVLVGDGPERGYLERRSSELGVRDRVRFLGAVRPEEVPALLAASDAFVLPSLYEGRPIALLEAMAAGLPVVASPVGGIPEIVDEGTNGLLVDARDAAGLARALERATGPEASRFSAAARATAAAHDIRESARRVVAVYEAVAPGGRTAAMDGRDQAGTGAPVTD